MFKYKLLLSDAEIIGFLAAIYFLGFVVCCVAVTLECRERCGRRSSRADVRQV